MMNSGNLEKPDYIDDDDLSYRGDEEQQPQDEAANNN